MVYLIDDEEMNRVVSHHVDVQESLDIAAHEGARGAQDVLDGAKQRTGTSTISVEDAPGAGFNSIDRFIVLSDSRGLGAANVIEFGRPEGTRSSWGPMEGLHPLKIGTGVEYAE